MVWIILGIGLLLLFSYPCSAASLRKVRSESRDDDVLDAYAGFSSFGRASLNRLGEHAKKVYWSNATFMISLPESTPLSNTT